ncbi:KGG domain-containing protein [Variovorax paradoxus]|jgi:general stress protein YciG|uniref:KGG domain-containing protein n=2 Tax=Variovorax paradoxus TaxID=34073 RepID=UPI0029C95F04|nr:KGG domain-containing protein [Variovorax paradoxus]WPH22490.1 KGG domain-containing protein [Variovorax paradoxus]
MSMNNNHEGRIRPRRGFAGMDPERQKEIARQGGRAAHAMGLAHEFTPEEARHARAKSLGAKGAASARPPQE